MADTVRIQRLRNGWTRKPVALTRDPSISVGAKWVYDAIYSHANSGGDGAFPTMATIAAYQGVTERTARRWISELEEANWLQRIARGGGETGQRQRSNDYVLMLDRSEPADLPGQEDPGQPGQEDPGQPGQDDPPIYLEDPVELENTLSADADGADLLSDETDDEPEPEPEINPETGRRIDPVFNVICERGFGLDWRMVSSDKTAGARIGKIRRWLKKQFPDVDAGGLSDFFDWYAGQYQGLNAPRDVTKFAEQFREFVKWRAEVERRWGASEDRRDDVAAGHDWRNYA